MKHIAFKLTARAWLRVHTAGDIRLMLANRRWPTGKRMTPAEADGMARALNDQAADTRLHATRLKQAGLDCARQLGAAGNRLPGAGRAGRV